MLEASWAGSNTVVTWEYSVASAATTWTTIAGAVASGTAGSMVSTLTIASATFLAQLGTNNKVTYRTTISHPEWNTIITTKEIEYKAVADDLPAITFSRETVALSTTLADVVTYTGSGIDIAVSVGGVALLYDATGTTASTFTVSAAPTSITAGSASTVSTTIRRYTDASTMVGGLSSTATIAFTITVRDSFGNSSTHTKTQYFSKLTPGATGTTGSPGSPGAEGTKAITVQCFKWAASGGISAPSQAFSLTWPSTVSAYPTGAGWTSSATTNTTAGLVLYTCSVVVTAPASEVTTTGLNWSSGSTGSIGYTAAGTIGPQGDGARIAYAKVTSGTTPSGTTTSTGTSSLPGNTAFGPTTWLSPYWSTSPPTLDTNESLFQSDGVFVVGTNTITWQTPYLSNLKVGSLEAITANLGTVSISTIGALSSRVASTTKTYADTNAGFFLGYSGGAHKFEVYANASNYLRWSGSSLTLKGTVFDLNTPISIVDSTYASYTGSMYIDSNGLALKSVDSASGIFKGVSLIANNSTSGLTSTLKFSSTSSLQTNLDITPQSNSAIVLLTSASTGIFKVGSSQGPTHAGIEFFNTFGPISISGTTTSITGSSTVVSTITAANSSSIALELKGYLRWASNTGANSHDWVNPGYVGITAGQCMLAGGSSASPGTGGWGYPYVSGGTGTTYLKDDGTWGTPSGGGSGTVTSVSVTTAAGVSGSVATATTTPAITITLGAITPTSVTASGTVTGSNISGTNTGDAAVNSSSAPSSHVGSGGTAHALVIANSTSGFMSGGDKNKLDNIAIEANNYIHPTNHLPSIITQDASNRFVTDAEKSIWNGKQANMSITSLGGSVPLHASGAGSTGSSSSVARADHAHPLTLATGSVAGYLSPTDWTTFNNKQASGSYLTTSGIAYDSSRLGNILATNYVQYVSYAAGAPTGTAYTMTAIVSGLTVRIPFFYP
jgi:hypothetical protein